MTDQESIKSENNSVVDVGSSLADSERSQKLPRQKLEKKFTKSKADIKLTPFYLRWCYGENNQILPINLTTANQKCIFYAAAHAGIFYNYENKSMKLLQGHQNPICSIAADEQGRWIVTADKGDDNVVIVWDTLTFTPIYFLFNPHKNFAPQTIGFSKNSKYLITVGTEDRPIIKFWLWTLGKDQPDAQYELDNNFGAAKNIRFNLNCYEHFLIAFEQMVIFGIWHDMKMSIHVPKPYPKSKGHITDGTFVYRSHNALTSTTSGHVLVWGNTIYNCPYEECLPLNNNKEYIKSVKLSDYCINCINECNGTVCIGDSDGKIKFFDMELKILYWIQKYKFDPIRKISFNPPFSKSFKSLMRKQGYDTKSSSSVSLGTAYDFEIGSELRVSFDEPVDSKVTLENKIVENMPIEKVPSDATVDRRPFQVRDFLIYTTTGSAIMYYFLKDTCTYLTNMAEEPIKSIVTHPEKNIVIFGNRAGRIVAYHISTHELLNENNLSSQIQENDPEQKRKLCDISCLTFSTKGLFLACGTESGAVWMLDPNIFQLLTENPIKETSHSVEKIIFSDNLKHMAFYDSGCNVCLCTFNNEQNNWNFIGKIHSHYKPIKEILFYMENKSDLFPRMFTLGEDRILVEYDIEKSVEKNKLLIHTTKRIEQSAVPICALWLTMKSTQKNETYLLVADNQYKYKFYDRNSGITVSTKLAVTFGKVPIQKMLTIKQSSKEYLIFATKRIIGLQTLPPDGNPYKYCGIIGHPVELSDICVSANKKYLLTLGKNDTCVLQWYINTRSIEIMSKLGGQGLSPFYSLIDGGQNGCLFKEIKDLFYYMQILNQGENTPEPRVVSTKMSIQYLSDLMRACGFFPTEYEIENMIIEVKNNSNKSGNEVTEIEFEDFVKLYINHKPVKGILISDLANAFEYFTSKTDRPLAPSSLTREEFLHILCSYGEQMSLKAMKKTLGILCHFGNDNFDNDSSSDSEELESESDLDFIPEMISFETFKETILGIDENDENEQLWMGCETLKDHKKVEEH